MTELDAQRERVSQKVSKLGYSLTMYSSPNERGEQVCTKAELHHSVTTGPSLFKSFPDLDALEAYLRHAPAAPSKIVTHTDSATKVVDESFAAELRRRLKGGTL